MSKKSRVKDYIFLHLILLFYAAGGIVSKFAGNYEMLSFEFIALYAFKMFTLFVYALLWQQALKRFELTTAFANKAITIIWGLVFGVLIFHEALTLPKVLGSIIIMVGIVIAVKEDE